MDEQWGTFDSPPGSCPDAELLVEFSRGGLAPAARASLSLHVQGCAECGQVFAAFTRAPPPATRAPSGTLKLTPDDPRLAPSGLHAAPQPAPGAPVKPGDVLLGKYQVVRVIGLGGMGVVVAATHLQLGQEVAIKLMLPHAFESPDATARFLREARAAAQIQGEHVAAVRDVGTLENGAPFMVMELLRGMDLARLLKTRGRVSADDAVDYLLQACEALAEAHGLGIIHRDLKPANLFLAERPDGSLVLKVLDFGISKSRDALTESVVTHSQSVMGTPQYMSPEQMRSTKSVGPATDIWALGCILYELLTGQPVFQAETAQGLAVAIASERAPSVCAIRRDVSAPLEQVIFRCLEKDASSRVQSIAELGRLLAPMAPKRAELSLERISRLARRSTNPPPVLGTSIGFAATVPSGPAPPLPGPGLTEPGFARSSSEPGGRGTHYGAVVSGLLLVGAAVAGLLYMHPLARPTDAPGTATAASTTVSPAPIASAREPAPSATPPPAAALVAVAPSASALPPAVPAVAPVPQATASTAPRESAATAAPTTRPTRPARPAKPAPGTSTTSDTSSSDLVDRK